MTVTQTDTGWVFVCSAKLRSGSTINCLFRSAVYKTEKEAKQREKEHLAEHKLEKKK